MARRFNLHQKGRIHLRRLSPYVLLLFPCSQTADHTFLKRFGLDFGLEDALVRGTGSAKFLKGFGGPDRDRTDDLFHAMEWKQT